MNLDEAYIYYKKIDTSIASALKRYDANQFSGTSSLWESFFSNRKSKGDFNAALNILNTKNDITLGVAIKVPEHETAIYQHYYEHYSSPESLSKYPVNPWCNPTPMFVHGMATSLALLQNAARVERLLETLKELGAKNGKLRVLEIGAGFGGMASQLIQSGLVESYTIIDLPDNLKLSSFYLWGLYSETYSQNVCIDEYCSSPNSINFFVPQQIDLLKDSAFDLVINCDSLGEMPEGTAQSYVEWISTHLSESGIFMSKNGHHRSSGTVRAVSQYGYQRFRVLKFEPTWIASQMFDDHSHIIFLGPQQNDSTVVNWAYFDLVADAIKLGLHSELTELASNLVSNSLTSEQQSFLKQLERFFGKENESVRLNKIGEFSDSNLQAAAYYLEGLALYSAGSYNKAAERLERFIAIALSGVAEAFARLILSKKHGGEILKGPYKTGILAEFQLATTKQKIFDSALQRNIVLFVRRSLTLQRLNRMPLTDSPVLKLKSFLINIKEGKGFSTERLA